MNATARAALRQVPPATGRIAGIELARSLALIGMVAVHVTPAYAQGMAEQLYALPYGRASILFVLLAGVGVSLLAASRSHTTAEVRLKLAWRAALLLPLGLVLQGLNHDVMVILQSYALLFSVGIVVIALSDRWLLILCGVSVVLGPLVYLGVRALSALPFGEPLQLGDPPLQILYGLLLSGPYPLITWAAPFLLGIWLGRRDLSSPLVRLDLIGIGATAALLAWALANGLQALLGEPAGDDGWRQLIGGSAHSQMPLWLIGGAGTAALVLGAALSVTALLGRLLYPLVTMGQLTLTIYVAHLLALHIWPWAGRPDNLLQAVGIVLGFSAVAAIAAMGWRALLPRGPLETLLNPPWLQPANGGKARPAAGK